MFKKASLSLLIFLCELFSFTIQAQVIACQNDTNNNTITLTFSLPRYSIHDTILPGCYNVQGLWNYVSVWNNDFGTVIHKKNCTIESVCWQDKKRNRLNRSGFYIYKELSLKRSFITAR